jgi:hypothetical protein
VLHGLNEAAPARDLLIARERILEALTHPDVLAAIEVKIEGT